MSNKNPVRAKFTKHRHQGQLRSYQELVENDSRTVPEFLRSMPIDDIGPVEVPARWYTDREIHAREVEQIWRRQWQMVCRVDEIPAVGDTHVYDVADLSFIIVRVDPDQIKGFWNACLHRGVTLRKCSGRVERLQCPFHGFTWGLDGRSLLIPNPEEFPHINPEEFSLPEVQVAIWQGFVFINPDLDAQPFEEFIGDFSGQFERWPYDRRQKVLHFAKVFPANWKAVQEAFMEAWHTLTTHPQHALHNADCCAHFGVSGNYSRGILPHGQTSEYMPRTPSEQEIWDKINLLWDDEERPEELVLPEGVTAREALVMRNRELFRPLVGGLADEMSDTEIADIFYWTLFPNFHPFEGFRTPLIYRFRPLDDNPDQSIMDVMFLTVVAEGEEPLPPASVTWIEDGYDFTSIPQLGTFGAFLSQDIANMSQIMKGLRNNKRGIVNFAKDQELKIRHFYDVYEREMGLSAASEVAALKGVL